MSTGSIAETTIYVAGLLEKVTRGSVTEYRHLIHGGQGVAAVYTRRTSGNPLTDTYYVHSDHLGSPELITNGNGTVALPHFGSHRPKLRPRLAIPMIPWIVDNIR